jgi:hypothetical protein
MITDELYGIGFGLLINNHPDDQPVCRDGTGRGAGKGYAGGLIEHFIGLKPEIEIIKDDTIKDQYHGKQQF